MATYDFWLCEDTGARVMPLTPVWVSAMRQVSDIGALSMGLGADFDLVHLRADRMVQVWRGPGHAEPGLFRSYLLEFWRPSISAGGTPQLQVSGVDMVGVLSRRIVAAYSGTEYASWTDTEADDLMKALVRNAQSDVIPPLPDAGTRAWSNLSVEADTTRGPQLTMSLAWRYLDDALLAVLNAAAQEAADNSVDPVWFDVMPDVVTSDGATFVFRTFAGTQPGLDLTPQGITFDADIDDRLSTPYLEYDYQDEANYVYGGGQGRGTDRTIQQAYDASRYGRSIWGRREIFAESNQCKSDGAVLAVAQAALRSRRPVRRVGGKPLDSESFMYGRDWDLGDRVMARFERVQFKAIVGAVTIALAADGREQVLSRLDYQDTAA